MEMKREADTGNNDITECSHDDKPSIGMLVSSPQLFSHIFRIYRNVCLSEWSDGVSTVPWKEGRCLVWDFT